MYITNHVLRITSYRLYSSTQTKEDFILHLAGEYTYEVLGGLHTLLAKQELHKDKPGISYFIVWQIHIAVHLDMASSSKLYFIDVPAYATCMAFIYCGLSEEECLRLASRHNANGHFNHHMTHRDYVSSQLSFL